MNQRMRHRSVIWLAVVSTGTAWQSGCPLSPDFDPLTLFAEAASTIITDTIFFALDSYLTTLL